MAHERIHPDRMSGAATRAERHSHSAVGDSAWDRGHVTHVISPAMRRSPQRIVVAGERARTLARGSRRP